MNKELMKECTRIVKELEVYCTRYDEGRLPRATVNLIHKLVQRIEDLEMELREAESTSPEW